MANLLQSIGDTLRRLNPGNNATPAVGAAPAPEAKEAALPPPVPVPPPQVRPSEAGYVDDFAAKSDEDATYV